MDTRTREQRARRKADRQGLLLQKCRRRDPLAIGFGTYRLVDPSTNAVAAPVHPASGFGMSLGDVEERLGLRTFEA